MKLILNKNKIIDNYNYFFINIIKNQNYLFIYNLYNFFYS